MNSVHHSAFSTAELNFRIIIIRIAYYNDMSKACAAMNKLLEAEIYMKLTSGEIDKACDFVDLCYDMDFLTRSEAFNIKHWLYWFDDPDRLESEFCFFEDFRYD